MKTRINVEYIINAAVSAVITIAGSALTVIGAIAIADTQRELDSLDTDAVSVLISGPLLGIGLAVIYALTVIFGVIPALVGITTGVLSSVARFAFTDHGTAVTVKYKVTMIVNYCIFGLTVLSYAAGILMLLTFAYAA